MNYGKGVFAQERRLPAEELKQNCTKAVDIDRRCEISRRTAYLLWRDVTGCAEDCHRACKIARRIDPLGQAEIAHERLAASIQQNVPRLEISVQNPFVVRVLNGARDLCDQANGLAWFVAKYFPSMQQASPWRELHAEKWQAVFAYPHLIDGQNVWVIETGDCFRFALEADQSIARIAVITEDALQGNDPSRVPLSRTINNAHSAAADLFQDLIIAQPPLRVADINLGECGVEAFGLRFLWTKWMMRRSILYWKSGDKRSTRFQAVKSTELK